jgi:hypothetical protein
MHNSASQLETNFAHRSFHQIDLAPRRAEQIPCRCRVGCFVGFKTVPLIHEAEAPSCASIVAEGSSPRIALSFIAAVSAVSVSDSAIASSISRYVICDPIFLISPGNAPCSC